MLRLWRPDVRADVDDELQFHVDMRVAEYVAQGRDIDEARNLACERLGDLRPVAHWMHSHDTRQLRHTERSESMTNLWQDIRHAMRQFGRAPLFAIVAIVTLAVTIGATTAVMSVVETVLVRPLPFVEPERLVEIVPRDKNGAEDAMSPLDLADLARQNRTLSGVVSIQSGRNINFVRAGSEPQRLQAARVGSGFFTLLGTRPAAGHLFTSADSAVSTSGVVLSYGAWQRLFGGDSAAIGAAIQLDSEPFTVIGVAPAELTYPAHPDLWLPAVWLPWEVNPENRGLRELTVIGRLRPDVSLGLARADLARIAAGFGAAYPQSDAGYHLGAAALPERLLGDVRTPLLALLGAVAFVLLIACANVANLLLVRGLGRRGEFAVRTALGARPGRLVRQLLAESVLLAATGAVLGAFLAVALVQAFRLWGPGDLPRIEEVRVRGAVLAVLAVLTLATGILFGLAPAFHAVRSSIGTTMRRSGRDGERGAGRRTRRALVVVEIALSLILLVGAGLMIRSFEKEIHVNAGFQTDRVVVFNVGTSGPRYQHDIDTRRFVDVVRTGLARMPGTQSVAVAAARPLDREGSFNATTSFHITGHPEVAHVDDPAARIMPVTADYFRTLGITLLRGRPFTPAEEGPEVTPVVIVNQALVRKFFPGEDPMGREIVLGLSHHIDESPADSFRSRGVIVGIAADVKLDSLTDNAVPTVYLGYGTLPFEISVMVRTSSALAAIAPSIRAAVHAGDPEATIYGLTTMGAAVASTVVRPRFYTVLLSGFAAIALLIATLGIYGVISYTVAQRSRELGIRMALGASERAILSSVLRDAAGLAGAGLVLGLVGTLVVTRGMRAMLFGVDPLDPAVLIGAVVVLFVVATVAAWFPARRAAGVDPTEAIRGE
jgi:predicted permease